MLQVCFIKVVVLFCFFLISYGSIYEIKSNYTNVRLCLQLFNLKYALKYPCCQTDQILAFIWMSL